MKTPFCLFAFLLVVSVKGYADTTVQFTYDQAGNRISRAIVLARQAAPAQRTLAGDSLTAEIFCDSVADLELRVYPNPTRGRLKVELVNLPDGANYQMVVSATSGKIIFRKQTKDNPCEVDMTECVPGLYLLRVSYKNTDKEYKIIRQ